jgi:hypothetical protein
MRSASVRRLAQVQGWYFVLTGAWPLLHFRSFEAITGRKPEPWLVKMVGLLAASIGVTLLRAARRPGAIDAQTELLATTSAGSFAAIDLWYTAVGRISPVYLGDAVVEIGLLGAWWSAHRSRRRHARASG